MTREQTKKVAAKYEAVKQRTLDECLRSIHLILVVPHSADPSILRVLEVLTIQIREAALEMARQVLHNIEP